MGYRMPSMYEQIHYRQGTKSDFLHITPDPNSIYFLTDSHQVYVGDKEYTTSALTIDHRPEADENGEEGRLYVCTEDGSSYVYLNGTWITVYDPTLPTVKYVHAGDTIECTPDPIITEGTVSHGTPEGATEVVPDTSTVDLKLGDTFSTNEIKTDKFGHVTGIEKRNIILPSADELTTVFKFKGTVEASEDLPQTGNIVGDVYYVVKESAEFVYLETGWEKLGPVVDLSGLVPKSPELSGYVSAFDETGTLVSAGYKPESGVAEGVYGTSDDTHVVVPSVSVDKYGRVTSAQDRTFPIASKDLVADYVAWALETVLR